MLSSLRTRIQKSLYSIVATSSSRSKSTMAGPAVQQPMKTTHNTEQAPKTPDFVKSPFQVIVQGTEKFHQVTASPRQLCDMELIVNGGFNPLTGFMNRKEYESVVNNVRLPSGQLWPIPIYFDIDAQTKYALETSDKQLLITDKKGRARAILHVSDIWQPNKAQEGNNVYGGCEDHCEIVNINTNIKQYYVGGEIEMLDYRSKDQWAKFKRTPEEVKQYFKQHNWEKIVAFQTRNPMHNAHIELTHRAASLLGAKLFLNPVVGPTKPGDIDYKTRMKCYQAIIGQYPKDSVLLSTLPLAMRMGGPREAMLHAIIRKNYGCTHFIIGRDHAGPGSDASGKDIYGAYEARDFVMQYKDEIGIEPVPFEEMVYIEQEKKFFPVSQAPKDVKPMKLSGTQVRRRLKSGQDIPSWFSPEPVVNILRKNAQVMKLNNLCVKYANSHPSALVKKALQMYGDQCAISFSGAQDVILIEYAKQSGLPFRVFSLDTGRLHHQTYEFYEKVEKHYGIQIEYTFPDSESVQKLVKQKGMFSFYNDGHQECCGIRKVRPLKKKLGELKAWITGVRKDQSQTRTEMKLVHFDKAFKGQNGEDLVKFNPLSNMRGKDLWQEINDLEVPYNPLHNKGFISIGCQPCTRPVNPGRHEREGRWWWQDSNTKECGLHAKENTSSSSSSSAPCSKMA